MTDIVRRLRRQADRFGAMDANAERPWVADAAWAAESFNEAADEIERLREERDMARSTVACIESAYEKQHEEIERLRAVLLEAEMKAEIADLEDVGRLIAIGRRQGIEAALPLLAASDEVLSGLARGECEQFMYAKFAPVVGAFRALLEDKP